MEDNNSLIKLNVGGTIFTTTVSTISSIQGSYIDNLVKYDSNGEMNVTKDENGNIFIDRSPELFKIILEYLRTNKLYIPDNVNRSQLKDEFDLYGLDMPSPEKKYLRHTADYKRFLDMTDIGYKIISSTHVSNQKVEFVLQGDLPYEEKNDGFRDIQYDKLSVHSQFRSGGATFGVTSLNRNENGPYFMATKKWSNQSLMFVWNGDGWLSTGDESYFVLF